MLLNLNRKSTCGIWPRFRGGAESLLGVTTVDPAGFQTVLVRRLVIVEHALGGVQDLLLLHADLAQLLDHVVEIPVRRFIGADVLGGVERVELHQEPAVAVAITEDLAGARRLAKRWSPDRSWTSIEEVRWRDDYHAQFLGGRRPTAESYCETHHPG